MSTDAIATLHSLRRSFGPAAATKKERLLRQVEEEPRLSVRELLLLQDTLDLMRAYPDGAAVRKLVFRVRDRIRDWVAALPDGSESHGIADTGLPGSVTSHAFSYDVARRLDRRFPGCLEVDWETVESEEVLAITIELLLTAAENEGMEDVRAYWPEWIEACRPASTKTDLQYLLRLLECSTFTRQQRECLYEACALPIRYAHDAPGSGLCEVELPKRRVRYQKVEMVRERFPLVPEILKPLPPARRVPVAEGRRLLDLALAALSARRLEILPLTGANPRDVSLFDGPRGIQVVLAGVVPAQRAPLSSLYLFLVLKNGVPIAYGPAIPFLGCCELGINLFPEFRGFEILHIYAQVMRVLHNVVGADLFFLTKYAMGRDNEDALRTGAFWFYRKLGFKPSNPDVEALAQEEEERMRAEPGYRSDRRMLLRLSDTEAWLDLSGGHCRPFDFAELSLAVSRFFADEYDADRPTGIRECTRTIVRTLGIRDLKTFTPAEHKALRDLAPVLAMMPDLGDWNVREKASMVRIIRGKGARSEIDAGRRTRRHPRFEESLRSILG